MDILDYYRAYSGKPNVVEFKDFYRALVDYIKGTVPPGFDKKLTKTQFLQLAKEWLSRTNRATLVGKVTDSTTNQPLPGVKIVVDNVIGQISDTEGNYKFAKLELGEHKIKFWKQGYKTVA